MKPLKRVIRALICTLERHGGPKTFPICIRLLGVYDAICRYERKAA